MIIELLLLLSSLLPVIYDGIERKIRAFVHTRIGPSILQTLYDLLKLMVKKPVVLHTIPYYIYVMTLSLICLFLSQYMVLNGVFYGDLHYIMLAVVFFTVAHASTILSPLVLPNPYSQIGGAREIFISLVNEPFLLAGFGLLIQGLRDAFLDIGGNILIKSIRLALILSMLALCIYTSSRRTPFDLGEADPELASGIAVELSGPILALTHYATLLTRFIGPMLVIGLLITVFTGGGLMATGLLMISTLPAWILYAIPSMLLGRTRIDLAVKSFFKIYLALFVLIVLLAMIGD
ncbi:MAG: NADH-quinone oxidoreductase subunit H [Desulfurococcaceae archaeon]